VLTPLTADDPRQIGPYRLQGRLGRGGMGTVYLGFSPEDRAVAVKVPTATLAGDETFRLRFRQEVNAARRVHGSAVAAVLDADPDAERPWMATEYVEGRSLNEAVTERGELSERLVAGLAIGLADALVAIHEAGVVHRDLKPANVLLAWDGPRVIDFGIASATGATQHTATGALLGTLVWMAPEQLRGERASSAADVFAWGSCVAFAAMGRPPFRGDRPEAVGIQIMTAEPDLTGVPPALLPLVRAAMEKDSARRPAAADLRYRLMHGGAIGAAGAALAAGGEDNYETALAQLWQLSNPPPADPRPLAPGAAPGVPGRARPRTAPGGWPASGVDPSLDHELATRRTADRVRPGATGPRTGGAYPGRPADQHPVGPASTQRAAYGDGPGTAPRNAYARHDPYGAAPGAYPPGARPADGGQRGYGPYRASDTGGPARPGGHGPNLVLVLIAVAAILLIGGGALALVLANSGDSSGDQAGANATASLTAASSSLSTPTATASTPSSSDVRTRTAAPSTAVPRSPAALTASDAATTVRSKGYEPDMSTFDAGRSLNVVVGTATTGAEPHGERGFVFADNRYLGTDLSDDSAGITVLPRDNSHVVLRYALYDPQDDTCCPSGGTRDIQFHWDGSRFVAVNENEIPPSDPKVAGSRR
jgi:serine/threonine protein kinase